MSLGKIVLLLFQIAFFSFSLAASEEINPMCPVLTDEKSEKKYKTLFQGKNVYLCCKKCLKKFKNHPEKYAQNIQYRHEGHHESNEGHDHGKGAHGHDHSKDHNHSGWIQPLLSKLHPIVVHFPIAGIFFSFLLQMSSFLFRDKELRFAVGFLLVLSSLSIIMAGLTGWSNAASRTFANDEVELVFRHRWLGIASLTFVLMTTALHFKYKEEKGKIFAGYMILLMMSVALVSLTGHFGGILVYGADYFSL